MSWQDNHERPEHRAQFVPSRDRTTQVVRPKNAFAPDIYGGYGVASVTGDRHDQVACEAAGWFGELVEQLSEAGKGVPIAAVHVGSAGKYRFWRQPRECGSPKECLELGARMAAEAEAAKAAVADARDQRARDVIVAGLSAALEYAAENKHGVVVDTVRGEEIPVKYGCPVAPKYGEPGWYVGAVLLDDGTVLRAGYPAALSAMRGEPVYKTAGCLKAVDE